MSTSPSPPADNRSSGTTRPVVEDWFTTGDEPSLLGTRCAECGTYFFPPVSGLCRNPACRCRELEPVELSRTGKVWSSTDARYQPPPPYVAAEPYVPFAIAAVELEAEKMIVLGQLAAGFAATDVKVGSEVELVVEPLYADEGGTRLVWKWRPL